LLTDSSFGWPSSFFINVPVGIIALILVTRIIRRDEQTVTQAAAGQQRAGFDWVGLVLSMVGVFCVVYAFTRVSQSEGGTTGTVHGWAYWPVWALLAAGVAILATFAWYELRVAADPVLDLRLFASYDFSIATVMTWLVRGLIFGSFSLVPLLPPTVSRLECGEVRALSDASGSGGGNRHLHR